MNDDVIIEDDKFIIVIENGFKKQQFDCPVCKLALRNIVDVNSFKLCGACKDCQDFFYWPNKLKWEEGWRPKKQEVHKKFNNYFMIKEK